MALRLTIENVTNLPDGGPISFTVTGRRSVDVGRDKHLDWTLPDPTRYISGKHCEIHYRNSIYWLHDVSTNGTFLNGSDQRMRSPHELKDGDRLIVGHYIIAVSLDEEDASVAPLNPAVTGAASQRAADLWNIDREPPSAGDGREIPAPRKAPGPVQPVFMDWTAGAHSADVRPARARSPATPADDNSEMDWASGPPSRAKETFEPPAPVVSPRRPVWKDDDVLAENANPFVASQPAAPSTSSPDQPQIPARGSQLASQPGVSPAPATSPESLDAGQAFARRIARGASLPENFFAGRNPEQLAQQLGELMRISVTNLMALLQARNEAKRLTRSMSHTTIQATENNPLKFAPTAEEAMIILFGPKSWTYLDARTAFEQGFRDLQLHQLKTYAAMQHAVSMLIANLDPAAIAKDVQEHEGVLDKVRSRKNRLWDAYLSRWKVSFGREAGAAVEAFMLHFADYYDLAANCYDLADYYDRNDRGGSH